MTITDKDKKEIMYEIKKEKTLNGLKKLKKFFIVFFIIEGLASFILGFISLFFAIVMLLLILFNLIILWLIDIHKNLAKRNLLDYEDI